MVTNLFCCSATVCSTVRLEQRTFGSLRWLDVCICTDASDKGFAFAVRERCRELGSEDGRVSVQQTLHIHPCQVTRASLHRARRRFVVFKFGRR